MHEPNAIVTVPTAGIGPGQRSGIDSLASGMTRALALSHSLCQ